MAVAAKFELVLSNHYAVPSTTSLDLNDRIHLRAGVTDGWNVP